MIPINYHHLFYFWRVAKAGSITRAREELLLSQPTLSLQLQELERTLGKKLLYRGRAGVSLTEDGRVAFDYCERIFSAGDQMISALKEGGQELQALRLGVVRSVSKEIVLPMIRFVKERRRDVRVQIFGGAIAEMEERLQKHTADLVVADADFSARMGSGFRSRMVGSVPIYFAAAPKLARSLKRMPPHSLELPLLLRTADIPVRKEVDEYMRRRRGRLKFSISAEIDDPDLIRALALQGAGVAALSALAIKDDVAQRRLVRLRGDEPGIRESVWFVFPTQAHPNPAVEKILQDLASGFKIKT